MAIRVYKHPEIPDVKIIFLKRIGDERGWFTESYSQREFDENDLKLNFVQENHSNSNAGVFRGMHFQRWPYDQTKLVRCVKGKIIDWFMDLRNDSKTFGKFSSCELDDSTKLIWIPRGFAHGIQVLEDDSEIIYKVDNPYAPTFEDGVYIEEIMNNDKFIINERDINWPKFDRNKIYFG